MVSIVRGLLAAGGSVLFSTTLFAQPCPLGPTAERVFAANSSNNRIYAVNFDANCTVPVTTGTSDRKGINGLAVLDDGVGGVHLIAADTTAGQVLFYAHASGSGVVISDAASGGPELPDGVSVTGAGDVFFVNAGPGGAGFKHAELWKIPRQAGCPVVGGDGGCADPGYLAPVKITDVDSDILEDTEVVPDRAAVDTQLESGHVIVLSRTPARVYHFDGSTLTTLIHDPLGPTPKFPDGAEPTGFAFAPDGSLLVTDVNGTVLRFERTGGGFGLAAEPFVEGLGNGKFRIAVGFQNEEAIAALTNRNGGSVIKIPFTADGAAGDPLKEVSVGVQSPVGVDLASSANLATFIAGEPVLPADVIELTFDIEDGGGGVVSARVLVFDDPRELGDGKSLSLCDPNGVNNPDSFTCTPPPGALTIDLGFPGVVPDHVRPIRKLGTKKKDPATELQFVLIELGASVAFDLVQLHGIEEAALGPDVPDCHDAPDNDQPRFFYFPDSPDDIDGSDYIDVSTGCGSNLGSGWKFSTFLIARDLRSVRDILDVKFDDLRDRVDALTTDPTRSALHALLDSAEANTGKGKRQRTDAINDMLEFESIARGVGAFELVARSQSIRFFISLL